MSKVSVCCPLYNKGPYVADTLNSVLAQTEQDIEILVIDNGSTDEGADVVTEFSERDNRVCLLSAPQRGPGHARNYGVQFAKSDWILFLDADDLIESNHIETMLAIACSHADVNIVAGGWQEFPDGHPQNLTTRRPAGQRGGLLDSAIAASPWAVHAAIVKCELVSRIRWPEDMDGMLAEDNAFWFSICLAGTVAYSESNGAVYRTQTANCRTQSHDIEKWFIGVHEAVQRNVAALKERDLKPNAEQSAALMRLYSELYSKAVTTSDPEFSRRALDEADRWLIASKDSGHRFTKSMLLRRTIGIATFERTKRFFGR